MALRSNLSVRSVAFALLAASVGIQPAIAAEAATAADAHSVIKARAHLDFANSRDGWKSTGLALAVGDEVTLLGTGLVNLGFPQPLEPRFFIWGRIGPNGPIFEMAANQHTFAAQQAGVLELAVRPAGVYWTDRNGTFPADFGGVPAYPIEAGADAVVWRGKAVDGLRTMAKSGDASFVSALSSYKTTPKLPEGFEYLWYLGQSRVFEALDEHGHKGIRGLPNDDGGIVKKPLDIPLTQNTRLDFDWLYSVVPALGPETEARFHDYLSIAIEFDNGQDITWMWSKHLAAGQAFTCPLPWWDKRETHIVLQSGTDGLGKWFHHSQPIAADYARSVGGEMPKRITGIWFINAGIFGGHNGDAKFANAVISDGDNKTVVFTD